MNAFGCQDDWHMPHGHASQHTYTVYVLSQPSVHHMLNCFIVETEMKTTYVLENFYEHTTDQEHQWERWSCRKDMYGMQTERMAVTVEGWHSRALAFFSILQTIGMVCYIVKNVA